ncbi:MAG: hypothetical protein IT559_00330 [Alphaproteobacteria bacterium]|nr:hypothetical protein [Alphaproteobacteria bacterium]
MVDDIVQAIDVTKNTYYRWRKEYGGMKHHQAEAHIFKANKPFQVPSENPDGEAPVEYKTLAELYQSIII